MRRTSQWNPAIRHRDALAQEFISLYFGDLKRRVLLVVGAGFDPRSSHVAKLVAAAAASRTTAVLIRENRPSPARPLVQAAESNAESIGKLFPKVETMEVDVFARDGAVTGGRTAVNVLARFVDDSYSDIVIDVSALSIGLFFPLVKYLYGFVTDRKALVNLHLTITDNPEVDRAIQASFADSVVAPHGFQGQLELAANANAIKLWMPHLARGKRPVLEQVFRRVNPDDVCPILPFPAANPRAPEELIDHYAVEFDSAWEVHARNVVYADQSNPLDIYRTIVRIDATRTRIFKELGGSQLILSPIGAKPLAVGTMLAAIERDFPVRYVEPVEYRPSKEVINGTPLGVNHLHHLWLAGSACQPPDEPAVAPQNAPATFGTIGVS